MRICINTPASKYYNQTTTKIEMNSCPSNKVEHELKRSEASLKYLAQTSKHVSNNKEKVSGITQIIHNSKLSRIMNKTNSNKLRNPNFQPGTALH